MSRIPARRGSVAGAAVVHGASELYHVVFGEKGIHARSAVGLQAQPSDVAVEVETIFEIE